ncbi:hypothetical protein KUTeg_001720, partial [Tegillarca granosa]
MKRHVKQDINRSHATFVRTLRHSNVDDKSFPKKRTRKQLPSPKNKKTKPSIYQCRRCESRFSDRHQLYIHAMQEHYQIGGALQQIPWNEPPWEREDGSIDERLREVYQ